MTEINRIKRLLDDAKIPREVYIGSDNTADLVDGNLYCNKAIEAVRAGDPRLAEAHAQIATAIYLNSIAESLAQLAKVSDAGLPIIDMTHER